MVDLQGKRGEGAFQWNWGGWFGGQVGATLWLIVLGILLLFKSQSVGGVIVALGVIPNLLGLALWRRRHSLAPYPAIQILIAACGVAALLALFAIRASAFEPAPADLPSAWFLLMYPALNLNFYLLERRFRKTAT